MLKPPHPIARAAYALTMSVNPNNHALDGGRASSAMELEAVANSPGCSASPNTSATSPAAAPSPTSKPSGSPANSSPAAASPPPTRPTTPTHRISSVLGLPFVEIPSDSTGRMDLDALEQALQTHDIGTVVATLGTTAIGAVDPLDQILKLQQKYKFRIHVDSAYGGYFTLASNLAPAARAAYDAIPHADSIVVDPHKHGLQPYGCGAVLFRDPTVGQLYKHDSPFTYFSSKELHLGEISLECSRAGASAVALWATQRLLPYNRDGEFARNLSSCREAALEFNRRLAAHPAFIVPTVPPALDIVFWTVAAPTPAESSALAQAIFDEAARHNLYLALATLPTRYFPPETWKNGTQRYPPRYRPLPSLRPHETGTSPLVGPDLEPSAHRGLLVASIHLLVHQISYNFTIPFC